MMKPQFTIERVYWFRNVNEISYILIDMKLSRIELNTAVKQNE
jgi:hypothetical protein